MKIVISDKLAFTDFLNSGDLYFNASSDYVKSVAAYLGYSDHTYEEFTRFIDNVIDLENTEKSKLRNEILSVIDYLEYPINLDLRHSLQFSIKNFENSDFDMNKKSHREFDANMHATLDNLLEIRDACRMAGSLVFQSVGFYDFGKWMNDVEVYVFNKIFDKLNYIPYNKRKINLKKQLESDKNVIEQSMRQSSKYILNLKETEKGNFNKKKGKLKKQLERYNKLYEDSKEMNKREAINYVIIEMENRKKFVFETTKFMKFIQDQAIEIINQQKLMWDDEIYKFTDPIDNSIMQILVDIQTKIEVLSDNAILRKIPVIENSNSIEISDINCIATFGELFNIKNLQIATKSGIHCADVYSKVNQSTVNLAMIYDYWYLPKDEKLNNLRELINKNAEEFVEFLNSKINKEVGAFSKKKSELKKQLETWKLGDDVSIVSKSDLLQQIFWLNNAKMYFYETSKVLKLVVKEADDKYQLDDEYKTLQRQLRLYFLEPLESQIYQGVFNIEHRIQQSENSEFPAIPFKIFMQDNKPDILVGLDDYKTVMPYKGFIHDGRIDRPTVDHYAYQSTINIGALYSYLGLGRNETLFENLKTEIYKTLGDFESWLMSLIVKNGGNFKVKKGRLKAQLESYKSLY